MSNSSNLEESANSSSQPASTLKSLDLIHARSLAGTGVHTSADNLALVAALRAVESVCRNLWAESIEGNAIIRESRLTQDAVLRVRAAIREALG